MNIKGTILGGEITDILPELTANAVAADGADVPVCVWYATDAGEKWTGHWSGTLAEIEKEWPCYFKEGRCTNLPLLTNLSLSRCFGPTPLLSDTAREWIMGRIWPYGNRGDGCMNWSELAEVLYDLQQELS